MKIQHNTNLAALISSYGVELKKAGSSLVGLCPFHQEKTPSFTVSPEKGFYHCFGCGEHGDAIDFIRKIDNVSFQEAMKKVGAGHEAYRHRKVRQHKSQLVDGFKQWEVTASGNLGVLIRAMHKIKRSIKTIEQFENYGEVVQDLSRLEHCLDLIVNGSQEDKFKLYQEHRDGRF